MNYRLRDPRDGLGHLQRQAVGAGEDEPTATAKRAVGAGPPRAWQPLRATGDRVRVAPPEKRRKHKTRASRLGKQNLSPEPAMFEGKRVE